MRQALSVTSILFFGFLLACSGRESFAQGPILDVDDGKELAATGSACNCENRVYSSCPGETTEIGNGEGFGDGTPSGCDCYASETSDTGASPANLFPRPQEPSFTPGATSGGSLIQNTNLGFYHWGWDVTRVAPDAVGLCRLHRPLDVGLHGSFGPGVFSNYDQMFTLTIASPSLPNQIYAELFDPTNRMRKNYVRDSAATGADFYTLKPDFQTRDRLKQIRLLQSNMQPIDPSNTNIFHGAAYAEAEDWDGSTVLIKLFDLGDSTRREGRVVSYNSPTGTMTITYKTWTPAELAASPTRALQIDKVTDRYGKQLTFSYGTTQVAGGWVVSSIVDPGNQTTSYTYVSDKISSVSHPGGESSSFTYGSDVTTDCSTLTISDMAAAAGHRKKTVYLSDGYSASGTIPLNGIRLALNGSGEVTFASVRINIFDTWHYEGGGRLKHVGSGDFNEPLTVSAKYALDGWSYSASGGSVTFTATDEIGQSTAAAVYGSDTEITANLDNGVVIGQLYDGLNLIAREYSDGTFETYCYNSQNRITRYRDREGHVTKRVYNSDGQKTEEYVGLKDHASNVNTTGYAGVGNYDRCATNDVQTSEYAVRKWEYVASGVAQGLLSAKIDELNNRTDYEYNTDGRLWKVLEPADTGGGSRATTIYTYDSVGRVATMADPLGNVTTYTYDVRNRRTKITYADTTTEITDYGTSGNGTGLPVKTVDRAGVVTEYTYDASDRLTQKKIASATRSGSTDTATPAGFAQVISYEYLDGTNDVTKQTVDGAVTEIAYDYRGRVKETKVYPRVGKTLITSNTYRNGQLLQSTDAYGRKTYYAYDATDGRLIRTLRGTVPSWTPASTTNTDLLALTRDTSANADFIIADRVFTADGSLESQFDGRSTETRYAYDSRGRETDRRAAYGTAIEARTETLYDLASNATEVRSPRYFDSGDTNGYQKAKETWTYNGRNRVKTHVEAPGTTETATESFTYDLAGRQATHTDFAGKVWTTIYDSCCDKSMASKNPLGHGSIRNTNSRGLVVHTAMVSDVDDHVLDMTSPVNAKTLSETTTRYDGRGRPIATTTWLVARGAVDVEDPPIAGLDSVSAADGLTTQYLYDDDLTDGVGLDSSGGVSVTKMATSGSHSVSLSNAITKLAAAQASGGAGISFGTGATGSASVVINPEDEISFTISDGGGRSVMSGRLDNYSGTAGNLLSWSTVLHDTVTNVSGFGDCLELRSIDALGKATKTLTDGAGRTIQSIDQLSHAAAYTYDAVGNRLSVRDPNNVGQDVVYDVLGRAGLTTDTASDTTGSTYDKAGNRLTAVDGKSNSTSYAYDARGRQKSQTDRLSGTTSFTYLATGQLASLTDAQSQVTSYTYDDAGNKLTETYPDHTGGSPGDSTYGIVTFTIDNARRVLRKQDQNGDTVTYTYDLAGRLTQRDYRTRVNSPSGTIADSDTLTYDAASRLLTAVSGRYTNTVTYTYDTAGRQATEALTISGQTYTTTSGYDAKGQLTSYTYPDSTLVERTYTDRGQLYQLKHASTTIDTRTYDNGGRMTGSSYHNGVSESRTYNADNTLATISHTGATIGNLTYAWDDNKNKTGETITGTMSGYGFTIPTGGYDAEDRLVTYNRTDTNLDQSWNLSLVGDWNSITTEGTVQSRTHGPSHELLTGGGQNVSTDVKGNITLIPAALRSGTSALALNWDMDNRLSTADVGNDASIDVTYRFDALGRRVYSDDGTTAMVYVPSGQQTVADYVAGTAATSPTYRYVYASYIDEPVLRYQPSGSQSLYYHRNQQYSVTALTDASGVIVERYAHSAYGVPTIANASGTVLTSSAHDNRYLYTGREWDESLNLYHYRARMYDPELGRFCGRDPIGYLAGSNSLYEYVEAMPCSFVDPLGLVRHHWFMKYHNRPGHGQALVDKLCRCPQINIDDFTTDYTHEQHVWLHGGGGMQTTQYMKYQLAYETTLKGSSTCCELLTNMMAIMYAHHAALIIAQDLGLVGNAPVPNFDLINWNTKKNPPPSNIGLYTSKLIQACGRDPSEDYVPKANEFLERMIDDRGLGEQGILDTIIDTLMPYGIPVIGPGTSVPGIKMIPRLPMAA